jgi:hypothetical protein
MTDAVEAFRQIIWLIFKWIFIAAGVLVGLAMLLVAAFYSYNWYNYDRHEQNVQFFVTGRQVSNPHNYRK